MSQRVPWERSQLHLKQACQRKQISPSAGPGRHSSSAGTLAVRMAPRLSDSLTSTVKGQPALECWRRILRVSHMGRGGNTKGRPEHAKHSPSMRYGWKVHTETLLSPYIHMFAHEDTAINRFTYSMKVIIHIISQLTKKSNLKWCKTEL